MVALKNQVKGGRRKQTNKQNSNGNMGKPIFQAANELKMKSYPQNAHLRFLFINSTILRLFTEE